VKQHQQVREVEMGQVAEGAVAKVPAPGFYRVTGMHPNHSEFWWVKTHRDSCVNGGKPYDCAWGFSLWGQGDDEPTWAYRTYGDLVSKLIRQYPDSVWTEDYRRTGAPVIIRAVVRPFIDAMGAPPARAPKKRTRPSRPCQCGTGCGRVVSSGHRLSTTCRRAEEMKAAVDGAVNEEKWGGDEYLLETIRRVDAEHEAQVIEERQRAQMATERANITARELDAARAEIVAVDRKLSADIARHLEVNASLSLQLASADEQHEAITKERDLWMGRFDQSVARSREWEASAGDAEHRAQRAEALQQTTAGELETCRANLAEMGDELDAMRKGRAYDDVETERAESLLDRSRAAVEAQGVVITEQAERLATLRGRFAAACVAAVVLGAVAVVGGVML